ncbi:uncharacterized protein LOC120354270 [Nilaparvata lugens]|uniref:uncharacterized protein LOC120354270 n=1 Tax=Nilaparvata lugens TaxID=108931 RepID=UPI00193CAACA|nr:uncharacterized protein LOC120354270 [Nilaparvata lugens]
MFETLRYDESNYNPKMMYHLDVSRSQHAERTLLMGSKWTKIYGNSRTNLICVEEEELARREFLNNNTLYLTKVSEQGSGNNKNKFHVDFNLLTLKIWNCTDKDNSKLSLYGVMNTFTIQQSYDYHYNDYNRVTLKEIKFYDGVTVLHGKVPGQGDMENYEFTEFKYLDVADMSSVKFEGSIEMAAGSGLAQVSTT